MVKLKRRSSRVIGNHPSKSVSNDTVVVENAIAVRGLADVKVPKCVFCLHI